MFWAAAAAVGKDLFAQAGSVAAANANASVQRAMNDFNRAKQELNNQAVDLQTTRQLNNIMLQEIMMAGQQAKEEIAFQSVAMEEAANVTLASNYKGVVGNTVDRAMEAVDANQAMKQRKSREDLALAKYQLGEAKIDTMFQNMSSKQNQTWFDPSKSSINVGQAIAAGVSAGVDYGIKSGGSSFGSSLQTGYNKASAYSGLKYGTNFGSQQSSMLASQDC
jgi:hypothetical protein